MSFLLSLFLLSWFPARLVACHFHCSRFPLCSVSTTWAFAKLGFCCTWSPLHWGQVEVVSARLDLSHETKYFGGICNFFSSISPQQRFEIADQCYSSVTAQFYSACKRKYTLKAWGQANPKGEASICLGFLLLYILSPPHPTVQACPMQTGLAKKEAYLFHLKFSLPNGIYFVAFPWAFPFPCLFSSV